MILYLPCIAYFNAVWYCPCVRELFKNAAWIPAWFSVPTWSFISEISGEITSVIPSIINAGIWKQRDFPAPVGMIPKTSCPFNAASINCSWPWRNSSYPKYCFNSFFASCILLKSITSYCFIYTFTTLIVYIPIRRAFLFHRGFHWNFLWNEKASNHI